MKKYNAIDLQMTEIMLIAEKECHSNITKKTMEPRTQRNRTNISLLESKIGAM